MSKRFGSARVSGCECTQRFTCRLCLDAAGPTLDNSPAGPSYRTGDGKVFRTYARASAHVGLVHRDSDVILSITEIKPKAST